MTDPRAYGPDDDVATARAGVRRAGVRFGAQPPSRPPRDRGSWLRNFVARYGWRAYALPVLAVITVVALMSSSAAGRHDAAAGASRSGQAAGASTGPAAAPSQLALKDDAPGAGADNTVLKGYALPHGGAYTVKGDGTFRTLKGTSSVAGHSGQSVPLLHRRRERRHRHRPDRVRERGRDRAVRPAQLVRSRGARCSGWTPGPSTST